MARLPLASIDCEFRVCIRAVAISWLRVTSRPNPNRAGVDETVSQPAGIHEEDSGGGESEKTSRDHDPPRGASAFGVQRVPR